MRVVAVLLAGCWSGKSVAPPAPPIKATLTMAVAFEKSVGIVELAGNELRIVKEYPAPDTPTTVHWLGTPAHDALAISAGDTAMILDGGTFKAIQIPWPELEQPPDTEPVAWQNVYETPDHHGFLVERCWFAVPQADPRGGGCLAASVANLWPKVTVEDTNFPHDEPVVELPEGLPPPSCSEESETPAAPDQTVVQTIVADPPISRVVRGFVRADGGSGNMYEIYEGCMPSGRFTAAYPGPHGYIVLVGKDLAIARNGKLLATLNGRDAVGVAFPP